MCLLLCHSAVAVSWCGDSKMAGTGPGWRWKHHMSCTGLLLQFSKCVWHKSHINVHKGAKPPFVSLCTFMWLLWFACGRSETGRIRRIWMRGWKNQGFFFFFSFFLFSFQIFTEKYFLKEVDCFERMSFARIKSPHTYTRCFLLQEDTVHIRSLAAFRRRKQI